MLGNMEASRRAGVVLALLITPLATAEGEGDLSGYYDILRDMHAAQKEALRQGRVTVEVDATLYPDADGFPAEIPVEILAEVTWSGESTLVRYKANDPHGQVLGRDYEEMPLGNRPWEYILDTPDDCIGYDPVYKLAGITRPGTPVFVPLLQLVPRDQWTVCCPLVTPGRPWVELIGPSPELADREFELEWEEQGKTLRQTRLDPDGSRSVLIFSLEHCGNVVRSDYYPKGQSKSTSSIRYEWAEPTGSFCALKECSASRTEPERFDYHLKVLDLDVETPVRRSVFSKEAMFKVFAEGTKVDDQVAGRTYMAGGVGQGPTTSDRLKELAKGVRSDGFVKPD